MKKLPYGISDYEKIKEQNYYYVDKTMYIEKIENLAEPNIMFLRPRKFGKTLFTSTLENYYDINKKEKFDKLFKDTYIGRNPTSKKNSYYILRFNFSGIDTTNEVTTINGFKEIIITAIEGFTKNYGLDFIINNEQTSEGMLNSLFEAFKYQRRDKKIYVIIDEYDHFANELLSFNTEKFKELVSKNGKVRKWYEILKKGTETIVDRIFITGVAPITLDSLTSGFNICSDKTMDFRFGEMLGFTKEEIIELMKELEISGKEQNELLPILKENYDGYKFSIHSECEIYNSNMCLYFLNEYVSLNRMPDRLIDMNIASDYSKLGKMLDLCKSENRLSILQKTISGEGITTNITEKFNPELGFGEVEFSSMLFYLGYLTIGGERLGKPQLKVPNKIMKEIYSEYFIQIISKQADFRIDESDYNKMLEEIALGGRIETLVQVVHKYLNNLSNRDFQGFDEKYVKIIFYCIAMNLKLFRIKSEMEVNRNYPDLMLIAKDRQYKSVMIEFKYIKKSEANKKDEKMEEAIDQIKRYSDFEEIKDIPDLYKYAIVAVNDEIYVEKVKS